MGGANNQRIVIDGEDWMRQQEKRLLHEERRPRVAQAADIMGPILGPHAVRLSDWNQADTEFNGIVYSEPGSLNSPNDAEAWIGEVMAQVGGFGIQTAWNYRSTGAPVLFVRTFALTGGTRSFTPWQQGGGAGAGDGSKWLTGAGAPAAGVGELGNFYLDSSTGDYYEKVSDTSWALRGSLQGPQGATGAQGPQGDQGDQGIAGPQGDEGTPGARWYTGTGAPDPGLGIVNDLYLDGANGYYYLKTGGLTWVQQGVITGPEGPVGPQGPVGPDGRVYVDAEPPVTAEPEGHLWYDTDDETADPFSWDELADKPILNYVHTQGVAASTWTIPHNLGFFPSVTVVDSSGNVVMGDVRHLDAWTVVATFGAPFGGQAYLS